MPPTETEPSVSPWYASDSAANFRFCGAPVSRQYWYAIFSATSTDVLPLSGAVTANLERFDAALAALLPSLHDTDLLIVTADHGNCEQMKDETGGPHTAHTLKPVPLYYVNDRDKNAVLERGRICDVAPTMLELMGLPKPAAMTGHSLRKKA